MVIVSARLIQPNEAQEMAQKKYEELKQILMKIDTSVITTEKEEIEKKILSKLNKIQDSIGNFKEEIKDINDPTEVDSADLDTRLMALLELIDSLDSNIRFKTPLISTENQLILVHSRICWIVDAQKIIRDPERARHGLGFTFGGERDRLATEFRTRYPKFAGYRLTAEPWGRTIQCELIDGPSEGDNEGVPPREILKNELDEFLRWELRKIPMEMVFYISFSQGDRKLFYIEIETVNFR